MADNFVSAKKQNLFNRKLIFKQIEEILKDKLPLSRTILLNNIIYEIGLSEKKSREYLNVLLELGKIKIENDIVMFP
jgi:hypothetical protein